MEEEVLFRSWKIAKPILDGIPIYFKALLEGTITLLLAHVAPSIFDVGNCALIDRLHVRSDHRAVESAIQLLILKGFGFDS